MVPDSMADEYPYLAELTVEHVLRVGYNFADQSTSVSC